MKDESAAAGELHNCACVELTVVCRPPQAAQPARVRPEQQEAVQGQDPQPQVRGHGLDTGELRNIIHRGCVKVELFLFLCDGIIQ